MKSCRFGICLISLLFITVPGTCLAEDSSEPTSPFEQFLVDGRAYVNARYRYEYVDQDGDLKVANASTLRSRLGITTGALYGFRGKLEFEDVSPIGDDAYNSTVNGRTNRAVVADPDTTEVNEAHMTFEGIDDTYVRGGREALKLDNLRFVGDVGWRQNNQTFDGANIVNESIENLRLFYGYVATVNRIFGDDSPVGEFDTNLNMFNIHYSGVEEVKATAYAYLFDVDDAPELSTTNYGFRLNGDVPATDTLDIVYDGEFAYQEDYEDNPLSYEATYWRASIGISSHGITLDGGVETLGSDDGNIGFSTPFATLHKWNGWADKFLSTPDAGLQDAFGRLKYTIEDVCEHVQKITAMAVYHHFEADEGRDTYGEEWDLNLTANLFKHFNLGVKYANYNSDSFATDTEKIIFTAQAHFTQ